MVRIICNVPYTYHTGPLFKQLNIVKISNMYNYRLATHYKQENRNKTFYLSNLAALKLKDSSYTTRTRECWRVAPCRSMYGEERLACTLPRLLNNFLNKDIDLTTLSAKDLRLYFLN